MSAAGHVQMLLQESDKGLAVVGINFSRQEELGVGGFRESSAMEVKGACS
jgi:hypothetical protein